jgi:hypothetical protein
MILDEAQRKKVAEWIAEGMKLAEIQTRLASKLNVRMTYMDVRFLVDDLRLTPKDAETSKPAAQVVSSVKPAAAETKMGGALVETAVPTPAQSPGEAKVSVSVDQIARPGAVVSGKVTFSDGNSAEWSLDQTGRLGLAPRQAGYRPSASDVQQFQTALETELSKMGF